MTDQEPERGAIEDQREDQREDGLVVEPDAELDRDLRSNDLPAEGEEG
ncbi:hypothetical protein [Kocuria rosea]|nr:hypothetical protein [Kocuria rosea]MCM3687529.1 hypothetical protein [Kocuria rosea]